MPKRLYLKLPKGVKNMTDKELDGVASKIHKEFSHSVSRDDFVKVFGSSIIGQSFGLDAFNEANKFLSDLSVKGRLKCRTQWCRACSMYNLNLADSVAGHVIQISFSNIIKLSEILDFEWEWERPESDWAKSNGTASQAFNGLIKSKSKPVWYVQIQSEANIMRLLGAKEYDPEDVSIVKIYNKILMGGTFEESGFSEIHRGVWEKLVEEIANRPEGTIPWPISDL